jgi:hypothetical protein
MNWLLHFLYVPLQWDFWRQLEDNSGTAGKQWVVNIMLKTYYKFHISIFIITFAHINKRGI